MSHPARLSLRAPPHLPFIQGFPGIPASPNRKPSAICGTVEVRIGAAPIKAKWVRVEIRKHEVLPPGFPSSSSSSSSSSAGDAWEHVGDVVNLWQAPQGKEWADLETADFKFYLALPEAIPPSVEMLKGGVRYELVAALCYRNKGGIFKKETAGIMKISENLRITKHELHSAWPLYNIPDSRSVQDPTGAIQLTVQRPSSAFGPTDRLLLTASLRSSRSVPFKLKGFECALVEVITALPVAPAKDSKSKKSKAPAVPVKKSRTIVAVRCAVDESVGRGGEKSARIDVAVPPAEKLLMTIKNARTLEVGYEMEVKAVCEGLPELKLPGIKYVVGPFGRANAQQAVRDIGHFDALCPPLPGSPAMSSNSLSRPTSGESATQHGQMNRLSPPPPQPSGSGPGFGTFPANRPTSFPGPQGYAAPYPPRTPPQGFQPSSDMRHQSSQTSTITTTTATTQAAEFAPQANGRATTLPNQRNSMPFPSPAPAGAQRTPSITYSIDTSNHELPSPAEEGVDDRSQRYSSMTVGTFGRWDKGLRSALEPDGFTSLPQTGRSTPTSTNGPASLQHSPKPITSPSLAVAGSSGPARIPKTSSSAWPSSEQEKLRLYHSARQRAAAAQQDSGASLDRLGMSDMNDSAPPEYAPPRPVKPAGEAYTAPSRPVSEYMGSTSPDSLDDGAQGTGSIVPDVPEPKAAIRDGYLTVAEEKDAQRRRYEAATKRVVSGSSVGHESSHWTATASPTPSWDPPASSSAPNGFSSSRNSEIRGLTTGGAGGHGLARTAEAAAVAAPTPESSQASTDPIASSSSSARPPPAAQASGSRASPRAAPKAYLSANEEKDLMRKRYEEAASRVARTQGIMSPAPEDDPPPPIDAPSYTNGSSSEPGPSVPPKPAAASGSGSSQSSASGYRSGSGSGPASSSAPESARPRAYMSAAEEKEMMKRRFEEATARVARAHGGNRTSMDGAPPPMEAASHPTTGRVDPASRFGASFAPTSRTERSLGIASGDGRSSASGARGEAGHLGIRSGGKLVPQTYMSAAEEKEMMRRRFEEASSRVARAQGQTEDQISMQAPSIRSGGESEPSDPPTFAASQASSSRQPPEAFMSASDEKALMRGRFEAAQAAVSRSQGPTSARLAASSSASGYTTPPRSAVSHAETSLSLSSRPTSPESPLPAGGAATLEAGKGGKEEGVLGGGSYRGLGNARDGPGMGAGSTAGTGVGLGGGTRPGDGKAGPGGIGPAPDAPPPPLPARPPADYINLLSPVQEIPPGGGFGRI